MKYKKLKFGPMINENFEKRQYLSDLNLSDAQNNFKFRSQMFEVKFNYKNQFSYKEELWRCSSCMRKSNSHTLL